MTEGIENKFEQLSLYACDGKFYWGIGAKKLSSRVRRVIITVDEDDLSHYCSVESKRSHHVADVAGGIRAFTGGTFVDEDVEVDIWNYRFPKLKKSIRAPSMIHYDECEKFRLF